MIDWDSLFVLAAAALLCLIAGCLSSRNDVQPKLAAAAAADAANPIAWPGPDADIHRHEIGQAILGPIGQLGEYLGDAWGISLDRELRPELEHARWLVSSDGSGQYFLELPLSQPALVEMSWTINGKEHVWTSPAIARVHLIPLTELGVAGPPPGLSAMQARARRLGEPRWVTWRWTK